MADDQRPTRRAVRRGAHTVVASLGPDDLLASTPEGRRRAATPTRLTGNPTGAGDSAVAGLLGRVTALEAPEQSR